jgi:hypothetical protein
MAYASARSGHAWGMGSRRQAGRALLAATLLAGCADAVGSPGISWNGFGTAGAVRSDQDRADVVSNVFLQPNGAGGTDRWSLAVDSKIGGQVDVQFSPELSAVLQVVSKHRHDNSWTPEIEWANLRYRPTDALSLRVGRTVAPIFMYSDTANVGHANPWLRGPQEIYGMVPITHLDGVDLSWDAALGHALNTVEISFGRNRFDAVDDTEITGENVWIISNTLEYRALTLRLGYLAVDLSFDAPALDGLLDGLAGLGNTLTGAGFGAAGGRARALARRYGLDDTRLEIVNAGVRLRPGNWMLLAEWAHITDAGVLARADGWYVTTGYRFRKAMPYVTVAELNSKTPAESGIPLAGLPPGPLLDGAGALNAALGSALGAAAPSQKSLTLGLRWDVLTSAALKFENQHIRLDDRSAGRLGNLQPGFRPGGDADVFSIALDFVF